MLEYNKLCDYVSLTQRKLLYQASVPRRVDTIKRPREDVWSDVKSDIELRGGLTESGIEGDKNSREIPNLKRYETTFTSVRETLL